MGVPWKSPNNQAVAKTMGCSLQTDSRALLPRTTPTPLIEQEVKLVPTWNLHPYILVSLVYSRLPKEKYKHQFGHKIFDLQSVLPGRYARATIAKNL